jgi:hypothetical protein
MSAIMNNVPTPSLPLCKFLSDVCAAGGTIFGGFCRRFVGKDGTLNVPSSESLSRSVGWDIDIWFKEESEFVSFMGSAWNNRLYSLSLCYDDLEYAGFNRKRFHLSLDRYDGSSVYVDFVISDVFPVNDFDVNCLCVKYRSNGSDIDAMNGHTVDSLISRINAKIATITDSYLERLLDDSPSGSQQMVRVNRIMEEWTIIPPGGKHRNVAFLKMSHESLTINLLQKRLALFPPTPSPDRLSIVLDLTRQQMNTGLDTSTKLSLIAEIMTLLEKMATETGSK